MHEMDKTVRLLDFNIYDEVVEKDTSSESDNSSGEYKCKQDSKRFVIQVFGINEKGETFSIFVNDYKPFFYVKVAENWSIERKTEFLNHIKTKIGKYYENSICECKIIKRKKLYGFDGGKEHKFIMFKFNNITKHTCIVKHSVNKFLFYSNIH